VRLPETHLPVRRRIGEFRLLSDVLAPLAVPAELLALPGAADDRDRSVLPQRRAESRCSRPGSVAGPANDAARRGFTVNKPARRASKVSFSLTGAAG
jgi:hypothetical protein